MFKKENIDIILVSFGDSQQNNQIFETFISESSSRNESYYFWIYKISYLYIVNPGTSLLTVMNRIIDPDSLGVPDMPSNPSKYSIYE